MKKRPTERDALREKQLQVVMEYIETYFEREGRSPSFDDIAEACYMTRSSVARYVDMLEGRGRIRRVPGVPRSMSLVKPKDRL